MDLSSALLKLKSFQFPFQKGNQFLQFPDSLQKEILKTEDLEEEFFILFRPIFKSLKDWQKLLLAAHPHCDRTLLEKLASEGSQDIRVVVAGNKTTPKKSLIFLAYSGNREVRLSLQNNPSVDDEILKMISSQNGFVQLSQGSEDLARLDISELKKREDDIKSRKICFLEDYRKPSQGSSIYNVDSEGRLQLVSSNFDTDD